MFVTQNLDALGRFDLSQVNRFAQFQMGHIDENLLREIFGERADFQLE